MPTARTVVGIVIAGGRSLRFAGEKAVAPFAGRPLLLWAVERLARTCKQVAVNARPGSGTAALAHANALLLLPDAAGDPDGPLAGVKAGLLWARQLGADALAVSSCDTPLLPEDLYPQLLLAAGAGAAVATADGPQPLCAVWPTSALPAVVAALRDGVHPPTWRLLEDIGAARVHFNSAGAFANINSRADLARLEASLDTPHQG